MEILSSDLYYVLKCRYDGPSYESSRKNGSTLTIVCGLGNIWFFTVSLLNRAIFGMFEGVQESSKDSKGELKSKPPRSTTVATRLRVNIFMILNAH